MINSMKFIANFLNKELETNQNQQFYCEALEFCLIAKTPIINVRL